MSRTIKLRSLILLTSGDPPASASAHPAAPSNDQPAPAHAISALAGSASDDLAELAVLRINPASH